MIFQKSAEFDSKTDIEDEISEERQKQIAQMNELRKELEYLKQTEWKYETIERLIGHTSRLPQ